MPATCAAVKPQMSIKVIAMRCASGRPQSAAVIRLLASRSSAASAVSAGPARSGTGPS
jgi:hypothetical protein